MACYDKYQNIFIFKKNRLNMLLAFCLRDKTSNPSATTISVHCPWAMGLLLGDIHLFEIEIRSDKPCLTVGRYSAISSDGD